MIAPSVSVYYTQDHHFDKEEDWAEHWAAAGECGNSLVPLKSGMVCKQSDKVIVQQRWPYVALQGELGAPDIKFSDLDFRLLVAGELEIIGSNMISQPERSGRIQLLKQIVYLHAGYSLEIMKKVYVSIVGKIEMGVLDWNQCNTSLAFLNEIQWILTKLTAEGRAKTFKASKLLKNGGTDTYFCKEYQKDQCTKQEWHAATVQGKRVSVLHICAKCWLVGKQKAYHPEIDTKCPYKSD